MILNLVDERQSVSPYQMQHSCTSDLGIHLYFRLVYPNTRSKSGINQIIKYEKKKNAFQDFFLFLNTGRLGFDTCSSCGVCFGCFVILRALDKIFVHQQSTCIDVFFVVFFLHNIHL